MAQELVTLFCLVCCSYENLRDGLDKPHTVLKSTSLRFHSLAMKATFVLFLFVIATLHFIQAKLAYIPPKIALAPPLKKAECKEYPGGITFSEEMTRPLANNLLLCDCHRIDVFVGVSYAAVRLAINPLAILATGINMNRFFLIAFLIFSTVTVTGSGVCYQNLNRCTPETAFATGIIWKNCADYCQKCKGRAGGHCEKMYTKECNGGYQCRCAGPDRPKSTNPLDIATCKLGL
ncbi:unnamed protein product [Cylicocyclus nassatus]|uniref:Uncharacterized protein n=1 Tax=Cylicocyclus nassatus TaxID=53992 RepID=A0AA36GNC7_CYLNA|nr:unnamed protein product [Cylicocyclus nassatus]